MAGLFSSYFWFLISGQKCLFVLLIFGPRVEPQESSDLGSTTVLENVGLLECIMMTVITQVPLAMSKEGKESAVNELDTKHGSHLGSLLF